MRLSPRLVAHAPLLAPPPLVVFACLRSPHLAVRDGAGLLHLFAAGTTLEPRGSITPASAALDVSLSSSGALAVVSDQGLSSLAVHAPSGALLALAGGGDEREGPGGAVFVGSFVAAAIDPGGEMVWAVVSEGTDATLVAFDAAELAPLASLPLEGELEPAGDEASLWPLPGQRVALCTADVGHGGGRLSCFALRQGRIEVLSGAREDDEPFSIAGAVGQRLLVVGAGGISLHDVESPEPLAFDEQGAREALLLGKVAAVVRYPDNDDLLDPSSLELRSLDDLSVMGEASLSSGSWSGPRSFAGQVAGGDVLSVEGEQARLARWALEPVEGGSSRSK